MKEYQKTKDVEAKFKIKAEITKRENDSVYFMKKARFTTSKDIDNPEYYFQTNRVKFVPGKKSVIGLTHMVIANVPTPIGLPFAFFPMGLVNIRHRNLKTRSAIA